MILFGDLHRRRESAAVTGAVLDAIETVSDETGDNVIVDLGDHWHLRYDIPVELFNDDVDRFRRWISRGKSVHFLPGNHDQYTSSGRHAMEVLQAVGVSVYNRPTVNAYGLWLPYRKDVAELLEALQKAEVSTTAFLHHGIVGARMNSGVVAGEQDGIPPAAFARLERVWCAHWHQHQQIGPCVYVGSPWQTRADEAGQPKGFVRAQSAAAWSHVELNVGRKFHRVEAGGAADLKTVRPGDHVRISAQDGDDISGLCAAVAALGAEVHVEAPAAGTLVPRLGLGSGATLRDHAAAYVAELAPEEDRAKLLALFLSEVAR